VDAVVVTGRQGRQVFTLQGAEHAYRILIESMNEGALTLTAGRTILYANQCFARMMKCPLETVTGGSFRRFLSAEDRVTLWRLLRRSKKAGTKIQVLLKAADGSRLPAQISIRSLARNGFKRALVGLVVTDLTEARQSEDRLRSLTHRVVEVQESERGRVALDLHDRVTQLLCAALFRSQALAGKLSRHDGPARTEAMKLRRMLGTAAAEVERISQNLRPSVLEHLGLAAVLRDTSTEFAKRTGLSLRLTCRRLPVRLSVDAELALFRILQEALKNVERHARARKLAVRLRLRSALVELSVKDDGAGFDPGHQQSGRNKGRGLGLLGMRERAAHVGGALGIKSIRRGGTEITVQVPVALANDRFA
jgi:PAS domain S-box-containing protein